jgi:hypothetical protein
VNGARPRVPGFFVAALVAVGCFYALVAWRVFGSYNAGEMAAALVTIVVIAWTAYETAALRAETVRQTELEQRPFVVLTGQDGLNLTIKNVGRGAAVNVWVPKITMHDARDDIFRVRTTSHSEHALPVLAAGEEARVTIVFSELGESEDGPDGIVRLITRFQEAFLRGEPSVAISYADVLGVRREERWRWNLKRNLWIPNTEN